MNNPWEEIKLSDYEGHMNLESVNQLPVLRKIFKETDDTEEVRINAYVFTADYKAKHPEIFKDTSNVITSLDIDDYKNELFMIQSKMDQENQSFAVQTMAKVLGIEKLRIDLDIEVGDTIRIIGGVFEGQLGIVEAINPEKQIVKVRISMFGRDTPAEIAFSQVSKLR